MDKITIATTVIYAIGWLLCFLMLKTQHIAEGNEYSIGNRLINILLSLLSWLMIVVILIYSWYKLIALTGYWARPVKAKKE